MVDVASYLNREELVVKGFEFIKKVGRETPTFSISVNIPHSLLVVPVKQPGLLFQKEPAVHNHLESTRKPRNLHLAPRRSSPLHL